MSARFCLYFALHIFSAANLWDSNSSLGSQDGYNALADGMLSQIQWWHNANNEMNPLAKLNFVRAFMQWKNGRQMDQYIGEELDKRYEEYKADPDSAHGVSVVDLVLRAYLSGPYRSFSPPARLDDEFRALAIRQIRLFVFVGHDSTASAICYTFYLLSKHPEVLSRLRKEHDDVFGSDPAVAGSKISENPRLINNLDYTLAIIKEVLRLFPPAGASRDGESNVNLIDDVGNQLPTDNTILWVLHGKYWVRGNEFLPERWLVRDDHELHPKPGTWRPFEVGPRNCIAQAMVLVELRVVLACLIRTFEVKPAYDEWDASRGAKGDRLVNGERVYQVERGAAHPNGGYPCRVTLAGSRS
jgi:cytochrome P450